MTATVKRQTTGLVHVETEHETVVATPEHPFATPRSGWIPASRLAAGDWVVSANLEMMQVLSTRLEAAIRPEFVFNLTVATSHAYLVGVDRLLVHNTKCNPSDAEATERHAQMLREREELNRTIEALRGTTPRTDEIEARISELVRARHRLQMRMNRFRRAVPLLNERRNRTGEELEAAQQELEAAQQALAEFETRAPDPSGVAQSAKQRTSLKNRLAGAQLVHNRAQQILAWESELAGLKTLYPSTEAEALALREKTQELRQKLRKERVRAHTLKVMRNKRKDPKSHATELERQRQRWRSAAYEADPNRPRDPLELLEAELDELRRSPESESLSERIEHLAVRIETMRGQITLSRNIKLLRQKLVGARQRRDNPPSNRRGNGQLPEKIAGLEQELATARARRLQLRLKERLLAELNSETLSDLPRTVDEGRVRELERELERELAAGTLDERHLAELESEIGHYEPNEPNAAALDRLWAEVEADTDDLQDQVLHEAREVDERVNELQQLLHGPPSPARDAGSESRLRALQNELREERRALEAVHFQLVNQIAHIQTTQASSSSGASWQQRLIALQQEQTQLREQWRARMQARLERVRRARDARQHAQERDEVAEAELAREMSLLQHELQNPVF